MDSKTKNQYLILVLLGVGLATACAEPKLTDNSFPEVFDDRLTIELVASHPDIVTPIGLAIDRNDALYLLESHTHNPPADYEGPAFDYIKKGIDDNQDGIPESWQIFADSIEDGMNLCFLPDGRLICVQKDQVLAFDEEGQRQELLAMNPPENVYDHAGLLGVTFDEEWLYVSRGNTGGNHWKVTGTDGGSVEGYGDGGNVMRCRWDGSQVEIVATGFWNPFDLTMTSDGRLLLVDNDPDSRGPNRLVEVVPGGDYGYQSLYGGSGIHPFLAWNGELPGTLPYAAGIGEAPSGVFDAAYSNLPEAYAKSMLSSIWEEHTIVQIPLSARQSSIQGVPEVLIQGDSTFHPVAFASNSQGDIYITDWVIRQYPNHGAGRLWRVRARKPERKPAARGNVKQGFGRAYHGAQFSHYKTQLQSLDPFMRAIARHDLKSWSNEAEVLSLLEEKTADLRLEGLLIRSDPKSSPLDRSQLSKLLRDESQDIRQQALIYIAKRSRTDLLPDLEEALMTGFITPALFESYLAVIRHLQPQFVTSYQQKVPEKSKDLRRQLPEGYILGLIENPATPENIRAAALPFLQNPQQQLPFLLAAMETANPKLKLSIYRLFHEIDQQEVAEVLLREVLSTASTAEQRAQALVALSYQSTSYCEAIVALTKEPVFLLQAVALRYLARCEVNWQEQVPKENLSAPAQDIWQKVAEPTRLALASDQTEDWLLLVDQEGDPSIGKTIFQSNWAICQSCHQIEGWGGILGPDLSHIGSSKSAEQLVRAIVEPSAEISPEWQGWFVTTQEGETHYGRQIDVGLHHVELMLPDGKFVTFKEPKDFGIAPQSLMPAGLRTHFSATEFNHLISYLISLK